MPGGEIPTHCFNHMGIRHRHICRYVIVMGSILKDSPTDCVAQSLQLNSVVKFKAFFISREKCLVYITLLLKNKRKLHYHMVMQIFHGSPRSIAKTDQVHLQCVCYEFIIFSTDQHAQTDPEIIRFHVTPPNTLRRTLLQFARVCIRI